MKRNDILLIALVLVAALATWVFTRMLPRQAAGQALVSQNGAQIAGFPLDRETTFTVTGDAGQINMIGISGGRARMLSANCPDQLCVRQGEIWRTGQTVVCLPGRVVITLTGASGQSPDSGLDVDIVAQ